MLPAKRLAWPGARHVGLGFLLGLAMAAGQAPIGAWWLTLPALAGLIRLVGTQDRSGSAAWIGLFGGAGFFAAALSWIVEPFLVDAATYGWMAPFALVLMALGGGVFWAVAAALAPITAHRRLGFATALGGMELARGYVLTGFPWALIGHVWVDTPLAQLVAWVGPSGLTVLTCLVAAMLAGLQLRAAAAALALLAAGWGFGAWQLAQPDPAAPGITLRLVQPNVDQESKWQADRAQANFSQLMELTTAGPLVDLTIWPETSLPYLIVDNPELPAMIGQLGRGRPVVVGYQRVDGKRGWNSLAVIAPDGRMIASYDKHHLVPFGEYIPFGDLAYDWFGLTAFAAQIGRSYSAGAGAAVLDLGPRLGKVLPLICYEAVFPQDLRAAPERAGWIMQITNDAWFGTLTGPYQHLAQARLRAIEQGLPLARVANTGITAMIDARGRITAQLPRGEAAYLDAALPGALPVPIYARFGEAPVLLLLAGLALFLISGRFRRAA